LDPVLILAGNPSEWTGPTGNNTWLLRGREPTLIDAGVGRADHLDAIARELAGASVRRVIVTHSHPDHASGIPALAARWPGLVVTRGSDPVADGEEVPAGTGTLRVLRTPGHAPDHLCLHDERSGDLFCGDLVRIGGTIVIPARKGGHLGDYLKSLGRVRALSARRLLPGHGPVVDDPASLIDAYLAHRAQREEQIVAALAHGPATPEAIVARVYAGLAATLQSAAADSVLAHLVKLQEEGRVEKIASPGPSSTESTFALSAP
jgi:glyoxylase-like metal-dependent hydrolase (beta-lactamase superfamily II)